MYVQPSVFSVVFYQQLLESITEYIFPRYSLVPLERGSPSAQCRSFIVSFKKWS